MSTESKKTENKKTAAESLGNVILKYRVLFLSLMSIVCLGVIGYFTFMYVRDNIRHSAYTELDSIEYQLTDYENQNPVTEGEAVPAELTARRTEAAAKAETIAKKNSGNAIGARAYLLVADIRFAEKNWDVARSAYNAAAKASPKTYLAGIALFNSAVCSEELADFEAAAMSYEQAAKIAAFPTKTHAYFSAGRVEEKRGEFTRAIQLYDAASAQSPEDSWSQLAKSRVLALNVQGQAN